MIRITIEDTETDKNHTSEWEGMEREEERSLLCTDNLATGETDCEFGPGQRMTLRLWKGCPSFDAFRAEIDTPLETEPT